MSEQRAIRLGLVMTAAASALGLALWCFIGFLQLFSVSRVPLAVIAIGSALVAFGSEVGSLFQVFESLRRTGRLDKWGGIGFTLSMASTASSILFAAAMLVADGAAWVTTVRRFGALFNTLLVTLDAAFNYVSLALHFYHAQADSVQLAREAQQAQLAKLELQREWDAVQAAAADVRARQNALAVQTQIAAQEADTGEMQPVSIAPSATPPVAYAPLRGAALTAAIAEYSHTHPGASNAAIAAALQIHPSTVGRVIKKMEV